MITARIEFVDVSDGEPDAAPPVVEAEAAAADAGRAAGRSRTSGAKRKAAALGSRASEEAETREARRKRRDGVRSQLELRRDPGVLRRLEEARVAYAAEALRKTVTKVVRDASRVAVRHLIPQVKAHHRFGPRVTMAELHEYQRRYAANPERRWPNTRSATWDCARLISVDRPDADRDLLAAVTPQSRLRDTTFSLASCIANGGIAAYETALRWVDEGHTDLHNVDCCLPAYYVPYDLRLTEGVCPTIATRPCPGCGYVFSLPKEKETDAPTGGSGWWKASILSLWINEIRTVFSPQQTPAFIAACRSANTSIAAPSHHSDSRLKFDQRYWSALVRFFRVVLLPCGLASRYNEPCQCTGQTAIQCAVERDSQEHADRYSMDISPAVIVTGLMPLQCGMSLPKFVTAEAAHVVTGASGCAVSVNAVPLFVNHEIAAHRVGRQWQREYVARMLALVHDAFAPAMRAFASASAAVSPVDPPRARTEDASDWKTWLADTDDMLGTMKQLSVIPLVVSYAMPDETPECVSVSLRVSVALHARD